MDAEYLDIHTDFFNETVEDIKRRNLSRNNMPKLIVGAGLSLLYRIPGRMIWPEFYNCRKQIVLKSSHPAVQNTKRV